MATAREDTAMKIRDTGKRDCEKVRSGCEVGSMVVGVVVDSGFEVSCRINYRCCWDVVAVVVAE